MRTKRSRIATTRTKTHILTGGLKENVAQIELRGGELIDVQNYQEIDGLYHGYSSLPGYELMDGTPLPSTIQASPINDYGNDRSTVLLLETDSTVPTDKSSKFHVVTNNGVIYDTVYYKFFNRSFYFTGASNLTVTPQSTYFDMDSKDYAIDFLFKPVDVAGSQTLVEKLNSYKISIESGKLKLWLSNNGIAYTHTLTQAGTINPGIRYHLEICRGGDVFSMFINGSKEVPTVTLAAVFDNVNPVVIGSTYTGAMEEIRFSDSICRHVLDFTIPDRPYSAPNYYTTQVDDIDREIRRTEILPIPGAGDILGVTIFDTDTYAVRNDTDNLTALLYKSSVTGWTPLVETLNPGGKYRWNVGQYPELADHQREPVLFFTSGVDFPKYLDDSTIVDITHANLPDDAGTNFYANNIIEFKSRLFLAYPDGRLLFSSVDNPLDFDPIAGAGEIYMEDEIIDLVVAPGDVLVVFCRTSTFLIKALADASGASGATTAQYKFYKETFSKKSGAIPYTSQRILGTVISMNDRGITNLEATDTFGDFSAGFLSKNVQVTLLSSKHLISATVVHRTNNQYRMFFSNGNGLIFTFDSEKKLKGVTKMKYEVPILNVAEGEDENGNVIFVFGSTDGKVYRMDSGTSFDGLEINTKLSTSFDSYQSPTIRKRFRKLSLELKAGRDLEIMGRLSFDYGSPETPRTNQEGFTTESTGGIWGTDRWGLFSYGSPATQNPTLYSSGYGKNMSLSISTKDKYKEPHILNAVIVEYTYVGQVM